MKEHIKQYVPILSIDDSKAIEPGRIHKECNQIELEVRYSTGGVNYMTGACSPRGYYLHAVPLEIEPCYGGNTFRSVLGTGIKDCLLEVKRQTDKQLEIACTIAEERAPLLLEWCREHYGIQFEMPAEFFPDAAKRPIPSALPKPSPAKHVETKPIRGMKLLTAGIIRKLEKHPFGSQEGKGDDATVLVKFFGGAAYTFLVTEGERQEDGDWLLFGKTTHGYKWEWGYSLLSEIERQKFPPFGLGVERDMYLANGATVAELAA